MIKFFRRIRQNLLTENKISKYLIYAIGEIALVVIGILIALQINNWNQSHHDRLFERRALSEIQSNLELDLKEIGSEIEAFKLVEKSCDILIRHLESNINYHDSLNAHFAITGLVTHFNPNYSGYKMLETKGIDLIKTDSLRRYISDLYTSGYDYYNQYQEERIIDLKTIRRNRTELFYTQRVPKWPGIELIPIDPQSINKDPKILANIQFIRGLNFYITLRANRLEKNIIKVIGILEKELS